MNCYYCDQIAGADPVYSPRAAEFDTGSEAPRCAWHWRFVCDHCGEPGHFMSRFYCPTRQRLLCRDSGPVEPQQGSFWAWENWWVLTCPDCGERHPSLDYAEFAGRHPWQVQAGTAEPLRWLSSERHLIRYPVKRLPRLPSESLTDADIDTTWSTIADTWVAGYDERGDTYRKYFSDPVLLAFLGEVRGQRILDAGSGSGYLSRLLARRGAHVVAVENARRLHEIALSHQVQEQLDVEYVHASISAMPFLEDATFDAAAANFVLQDVLHYEAAIAEIARLLRPGGRFACVVSHNSLDGRWYTAAHDSPRREDRLGWLDDDYFVRRAGYIQWGHLAPFISFHRPLRDYVAACKAVALELRDLDEPELSAEGRGQFPQFYVQVSRRAPFSYVLKFMNTTKRERHEDKVTE